MYNPPKDSVALLLFPTFLFSNVCAKSKQETCHETFSRLLTNSTTLKIVTPRVSDILHKKKRV